MPLHFNLAEVSRSTTTYVTTNPLPNDATFHVLCDNTGTGKCVVCRRIANGVCWGGSHWVMCEHCATTMYDAPSLVSFTNSEESSDDNPLTTKRDKAFDPGNYRPYTYDNDLSGRHGCAGYRCEKTVAPARTLVRNVEFFMGAGNKGYLCSHCFGKLKAKWDEVPRALCSSCETYQPKVTLRPVLPDNRLTCPTCVREYYLDATQTDGGLISRAGAIPLDSTSRGRLYASPTWAALHWFRANDRWFETEAEADAVNYSVEIAYRDSRIASNSINTVFPYGTNIIKMLGFPSVTAKDDLCFGVELEMVPKADNHHQQVIDALGGKWVGDRPYILCRDGSLGDKGVEMITLPYTLAAHKSDKFIPWKKTLADLRHVAMSGKITKVCGMHVHINRRALSQLQMGKMLVVINAPEMQELICCIAQRNDGGYAHRKFTKVSDGKIIEGSHFDALNIATNKGTCELRIFRGNLRYERVMKNIEFTEALCMYAAQQSMQLLTQPHLLAQWIYDNAAHYPYLSKFIREEYKPTGVHKARIAIARATKDNEQWRTMAMAINVAETDGDI